MPPTQLAFTRLEGYARQFQWLWLANVPEDSFTHTFHLQGGDFLAITISDTMEEQVDIPPGVTLLLEEVNNQRVLPNEPNNTGAYVQQHEQGFLFVLIRANGEENWRLRITSSGISSFLVTGGIIENPERRLQQQPPPEPPPQDRKPPFRCRVCKASVTFLALSIMGYAASNLPGPPDILVSAVATLGLSDNVSATNFLQALLNFTSTEIAERLCQWAQLCD
jgi:hypothetical protein